MDRIFYEQLCKAEDLGCFINVDSDLYPQEPAMVPSPEELRSASMSASPVLQGVPYVVKDVVETAIFPTTAGTAALENNVSDNPAPLIRRLNKAGAALFGTTNLHELSFGITSNNAHTSAVRNPLNDEVSAGGSSGGAAVAVALGLVQFAVAADTGGSARLPAAFCGVYGFRPTHGRYPSEGVVPISPTRDTLGLIADSVETIAAVDAVITGDTEWAPEEYGTLQGLRVGVAGNVFGQVLDPVVTQAWEKAQQKLESLGVELVPVDVAAAQEVTAEIGMPLCLLEFPTALEQYLDAASVDVSVEQVAEQVESRDVAAVFEAVFALAPADAAQYQEQADHLAQRRTVGQEAYAQALANAGVDVMLYPTSAATAPQLRDDGTTQHLGQKVDAFALHTAHAHLAGVLGFPAVSIQVASCGMPVGVDVAGAAGDDRRLLAVSAVLAGVLK